jgi:hypothetical protein
MLDADKLLQVDVHERMEVGCRLHVGAPRDVLLLRFESALGRARTLAESFQRDQPDCQRSADIAAAGVAPARCQAPACVPQARELFPAVRLLSARPRSCRCSATRVKRHSQL